MLLSKHLLLIVFTLICCSGCGFKPLYGDNYLNVDHDLSAIYIEEIPKELGRKFHNHLQDLLNPTLMDTEERYKLTIKLHKENTAYAIQKDSVITRYNIILSADYKLTSIADNKVIDQGTLKVTSSYNASNSEFATYVSEEDATTSSIKELCEELSKKLIFALY